MWGHFAWEAEEQTQVVELKKLDYLENETGWMRLIEGRSILVKRKRAKSSSRQEEKRKKKTQKAVSEERIEHTQSD